MSVSYKLSLQVFHSALAVVPLKRAVGDGATVSSGVVKRASKLQPSSAERRLSQQYSLYGGKKESNNKKKVQVSVSHALAAQAFIGEARVAEQKPKTADSSR